MPRFDSLTTSLDAPITAAAVESEIAAFGEVTGADLTGLQAVAPGGLMVPVIFDGVTGNSGGEYDFTTGVYTAPVNGLYQVAAQVQADAPTSCNLSLQVDAGPGQIAASPGTVDPSAGVNVTNLDFTLALNAGQTMVINFEDVGGAGINLLPGSNVTFQRIS